MRTTRVVVIQDGLDAPTEVFFHTDAISIDDEQIPVMFGIHYDELAGWAAEPQRDEKTGALSFELTLNDEIDMKDFSPSIFVTSPVMETRDGLKHLISARLRSITLIANYTPGVFA